jgi:lipid II:glycine glycyltransferase (peptidoglycan interpeptide bridge formation enzyme)
LKINPAIEQPSEIERWYCQKGFLPADFRDMHICTFRIDLTDDLAKVWENFRGSVRTAVRKAEKSGVCVQGSEDNAALEKFYTVYSALAKAGRLRIHSYKFISDVYERLYRKGQVRIFNAIYKDRPIATEFLFLYSKKAEQMWAASLKLDNDLGASQLIHWRIVKWLKDNGFQVYDLGGVPPDKTELPGISFYKQSLGGKYVELLNEQELPGNPLLYFLWRKFGKFYINRKKS